MYGGFFKHLEKFRFAILGTLVLGALVLVAIHPAQALDMGENKTALLPHRAVYDLNLLDVKQGSQITDVDAQLNYDFSGSKCEGYTVNIRFLMNILDRLGTKTKTDIRTSSWEGGDSKTFRFSSNQYMNNKLAEKSSGRSSKNATQDGIKVFMEQPKSDEGVHKGKIMFPTEHTNALLDAARSGKRIYQADIYDGTEKGTMVYATTGFISQKKTYEPFQTNLKKKIVAKIGEADKKDIDQALKGQAYWSISLSFFNRDDTKKVDALPDYEMSFDLYENGVSDRLVIDYGDFSLKGRLSSITPFARTDCGQQTAPQTP